MKELTEQDALCRAAAYCAAAERCLAEVDGKLSLWGISGEGRERILTYLMKERYVDEARYVRSFINDKLHFNKWGRGKIVLGLKRKNVSASVYAPALDEIDEDDYLDVLRALLAAKRKTVKARNDYERNGKLIRFALGRGFEMDAIRRCLPDADDEDAFPD